MKSFVISGTWGEYDDYTQVPMFVCNSVDEANLFCEALDNKERPFWDDVEKYFGKEYILYDIHFIWKEVSLLKI